MYQLIIFSCWIALHYITIPYFIHSPVDGHWDCFQVLTIINNAAMNIDKVFVWTYVFISLG